jgi:hypothetical protein
MEPKKEKKAAGSNIMADINARMTAMEVSVKIDQVCASWHT